MAGMTKEKITGNSEKKFLKLAWSKRKNVAKKEPTGYQ
jgi:hypothetical protein